MSKKLFPRHRVVGLKKAAKTVIRKLRKIEEQAYAGRDFSEGDSKLLDEVKSLLVEAAEICSLHARSLKVWLNERKGD